jgi:hypothetical protein
VKVRPPETIPFLNMLTDDAAVETSVCLKRTFSRESTPAYIPAKQRREAEQSAWKQTA